MSRTSCPLFIACVVKNKVMQKHEYKIKVYQFLKLMFTTFKFQYSKKGMFNWKNYPPKNPPRINHVEHDFSVQDKNNFYESNKHRHKFR